MSTRKAPAKTKKKQAAKSPDVLLRALARTASTRELKALFAHVRALRDKDLLAEAATPTPRRRAQRRRDSLAAEVTAILKPILARAPEKAELLLEHMADAADSPLGAEALAAPPRGVADAVKRLRRSFSDEEIRAGAIGLIAKLARSHSTRETVV